MPDIGPPVDIRALFEPERRGLIETLKSLESAEWWHPTVCGDWTVHDVAIHLLGADVNILSADRDGFRGSPYAAPPGDLDNPAELVAFIDHRNATWVEGLARVSPQLLIELLQWTGDRLDAYWPSVDLDASATPVSWSGPGPSPAWFHVARELTERWTHQHHIRDATDRPMLDNPALTNAVLDTFARAIPYALRGAPAKPGDYARLTVSGTGGGQWTVLRDEEGWRFTEPVAGPLSCEVECTVDTAWRVFTLGVTPTERRQRMRFVGNPAVAECIVDMVAIVG
jgi:uncharacterized protein (TIGR03083 family)